MTERDRILELIKNGVLSTEEGLDLLENLAKKENKQSEEQEFGQNEDTAFEEKIFNEEDLFEDENADFSSETADSDIEDEYEELANEINQHSAHLDKINDQLSKLKEKRSALRSDLDDLTVGFEKEKKEKLEMLRTDLDDLNEELRLVKSMDEIDNLSEIKQLQLEIGEIEKSINEIELKENTENEQEIKELNLELEQIEEEIEKLQEEKTKVMKELHSSKMKQWSNKAKDISSRLEIPDSWRDEAENVFTKASETFETTGKDLNNVFKKSIAAAKTAFDSVEWKNRDFKVPTIATKTIEKEWTFDEHNPTILDFKNANGNVRIEENEEVESIQIGAKITLYGKMDEETAEEAFDTRSNIKVDEDKLTFHIPNKRVKAELNIKLPKQTYDYIALNVLNGEAIFNHIDVKDAYIKSTNGDFQINDISATMVEIKGTNGNVLLNDVDMRDLIVNTINGDIRVKGHINSSNLVTTAGSIRATLFGEELTHIEANSVNGDVKIAVPKEIDIEVDARTVFGKVKSRLSNVHEEPINEKENKNNKKTFIRLENGEAMRINIRSTTGNVLLKDTGIDYNN